MKSENIIWLVLLVLFSFLFGLEIYLWQSYESRMHPIEATAERQTTQYETSDYSLQEESSTEQTVEVMNEMNIENNSIDNTNYKYIFVGDSRYVEMEKYAKENDTFIAENGVGYYFLINHMSEIVSLSDENTKIIVGLGVNDILLGSSDYKKLLVELDKKTDATVYYMLINPVDDDICSYVGYKVSNAMIDEFNTKIEDELIGTDIKIINVNTYLKETGFTSFDGLHYSDDTTEKIYNYIKEAVSAN